MTPETEKRDKLLVEKLNTLFKESITCQICPIDLIENFERFEVDKLIKFISRDKNISPYKSIYDYTPLQVFKQIREIHIKKLISLQNTDENLKIMKEKLKNKYNLQDNDKVVTIFNVDILEKIRNCDRDWDKYSKQEAINIYHTLILYIFACDFYEELIHPSFLSSIKIPGK